MKHLNLSAFPKLSSNLRNLVILLLVFASTSIKSYGQVSAYTFAQSTSTYTALTSPTTLQASGWDDAVASVTIPFTFYFNKIPYTTCSVNSNGYLTFGTTVSASTGYTPISATTAYAGAVAAFARDLTSNSSTIVYGTTGTTPNRVFIVQWNNARRYNGGAVTGDVLNFQIRLYEGTNKVEVGYGTCTETSTTTGITVQVGLRGAANTDYNDRTVTTSWASSTAGSSNAAVCANTNTIVPAANLTFTWTPAAVAYRGYFYGSSLGSTTWCPGETRSITVSVLNTGTATWTDASPDINIGAKWNTNGANWADYYIRTDAGGLAPGATATYTMSITASNNIGAGYTTNLASGTNNLNFDIVKEGDCWFASNTGNCGPSNSVYTSAAQTIAASLSAIAATPSPATAATGVCYAGSGAVTTISWAAVTGATLYDVYFGTSSTPTTLVSANQAGVSYTTGTLLANTQYYWKVVAKNACGTSTGTPTVWNFTTSSVPCYCTPTGDLDCSSFTDDITNVTFNTLNNTTTCGSYTIYPATGTQTTSVGAGNSYTLALTSGAGSGTHGAAVWIDFNQNGLFTDAGEYFLISNSIAAGTTTNVSIPIPSGATTGATRMRVRYAYGVTVASTMSCTMTGTYGETEDYTITITTPCSPPGTQASALSYSSIAQTTATVTLGTRGTGAGVIVVAYPGASAGTAPSSGTTYSGSLAYTGGTALGTGYVVYSGTGSAPIALNLTGLTAGTQYTFVAYEYAATGTCYNTTTTGTTTFTTAPACISAGITPANGATGLCYSGSGTLTTAISWTAVTGATSYDVYFGTAATPPLVSTAQAGVTYSIGTLSASTTYYWKVISKNSFGSSTGCTTYSFTTAAVPCYCVPTYSSGGSTDNVTNVTLGTLNNTPPANVSPYYFNQTSVQNAVPVLVQGNTYTLSVTFGTDATQYNGVWIDFNQDGTFATSEFFSSNAVTGASGTASITITVPSGSTAGNTLMRIRGGDDAQPTSGQACGASGSAYGEGLDYYVNIAAPNPPSVTSLSTTTTCVGSTIIIYGSNLTGATVKFYNNVSATVVSNTGSAITVTVPSGATNGVITVNTSYGTATSASISLATGPTAAISPTAPAVCGTTPATLTASGGTSYQWSVTSSTAVTGLYTSSAASTAYTAGANQNPMYAKPSSTTSYSVTVTDGNTCTASVSVSVSVTASLPYLVATATPSLVCPNGNSSLTVNAQNTNSYTVANIPYTLEATPSSGVTTYNSSSSFNQGTTGDDDYFAAVMPFYFSFYGTSQIVANISTNGYVILGSTGSTAYTPYTIPSTSDPEPMIAACLRDLDLSQGGTITYFTLGSSPYRRFVINYNAVPQSTSGPTPTVTAQIVLYESTNKIRINSVNIPSGTQVQGIQNSTGSSGLGTTSTRGSTATAWSVTTGDSYEFSPYSSYTYTWSPHNYGVTDVQSPTATNITASQTYTVGVNDASTGCTYNTTVPVTVIAIPTAPTVSPTAPNVCANTVQSLTASGVAPTAVTVFSENFNNGYGQFNSVYSVTTDIFGFEYAGPFTSVTAPYTLYTNAGYTASTSYSVDGTPFIIADFNYNDNGNYSEISYLTSPDIDLTNYASATLTYQDYYRWVAADATYVQVSTDEGNSWTTIKTYTAIAGSTTTPANESIDLTPYVGNIVSIRFNITSKKWYWAIDNFAITGVAKTNFTWSPNTDLYGTNANALAGTPLYTLGTQQAVTYTKPTANRTYTVTYTNQATSCLNTVTVPVTALSSSSNVTLNTASVTAASETCVENGWTYYRDPSDATKWLFAIRKNGTSSSMTATVDITKSASTIASAVHGVAGHENGSYLLSRYWNVNISTGSVGTPVDVKYYYDPTDSVAAVNARNTIAASYSCPVSGYTPWRWFKSVGSSFSPSNITGNKFAFANITLTPATYGTDNGTRYVEFDGITSFSGGTGGVGFNVGDTAARGVGLPVTLLYLTATAEDNSYIKLDWATASELNNKGFELERSLDGVKFETITWADGHGSTNEKIEYSYNDKTVLPNNIYYYRLKQIDLDSKYAYSDMVSGTIIGKNGFALESIRPNPAADKVNIEVVSTSVQDALVIFTDMLGRTVLSQHWQIADGVNGMDVDISSLAIGSYNVTLKTEGQYVTKKLIVSK